MSSTKRAYQSDDRNLALELVRVTEAAALAAANWTGRGLKNEADGAAVEAMRLAFDAVAISGTVVIGEGEMDEAPMLYIGEQVGAGGPAMDIAVDPLEGTNLTAKNAPNALTVVALAERGNFLHAPDIYMDKIAVGPGLPNGVVDLDNTIGTNLRELARAQKRDISELTLCTLDRPRHEELIARTREAGARVMLISDGDVAAVVATAMPGSGVDIFAGSGGAPEGVLAAAAMRCVNGQMQGRLLFEDEDQVARAREMDPSGDPRRKLGLYDMAKGDVLFSATGVTDGALLRGVRFAHGRAITHTIVMRSKSGTIRFIEGQHDFKIKTWTAR
ncbi:fructose-1,6-bisphosphatase II / sedoheptulose-1,7-bisphosphatase [Endobacter medicaginis]|uniref:Fructose-1,6-bisphosphatase n=2 Tax=Endobacter medicaginis TaxID=1181271 RepID=A0A850NTC1_9PROT|nr:class II fructose-bisphosphatase [Endobacter medicaginis]MBB3173442.1 fructose-1,6-bisphosphatase II / sedoheptulose-1,7-bisphosphatase [Endobacter medicaginis]MCX5475523.1 class II fructose-bisphosphatase [Endobacter medicaginis]NVN30168.1 class II fructose-bisphosphatase [Endobacter medicaginis]